MTWQLIEDTLNWPPWWSPLAAVVIVLVVAAVFSAWRYDRRWHRQRSCERLEQLHGPYVAWQYAAKRGWKAEAAALRPRATAHMSELGYDLLDSVGVQPDA